MIGEGINFSGSLEMMVKNMSSALLWRFLENSFKRLRSLSSISIVILNTGLEKVYFLNGWILVNI